MKYLGSIRGDDKRVKNVMSIVVYGDEWDEDD